MKKVIFFSIAALSGLASLAQQKETKAPPPPPKVNLEKFAPPPPPKPPANQKTKSSPTSNGADYTEFLKRNPTVKRVGWASENTVRIYLKSGPIEKYDLKNESDLRTVKNKYGELPKAPPPPPKPTVKKFDPPVIKAE